MTETPIRVEWSNAVVWIGDKPVSAIRIGEDCHLYFDPEAEALPLDTMGAVEMAMRSAGFKRVIWDDQSASLTRQRLRVCFASMTEHDVQTFLDDQWNTHITATSLSVLTYLIKSWPKVITKPAMYDSLYSHRQDGGPNMDIISVYVCRMKPALAKTPFEIKTMWGGKMQLDIDVDKMLQDLGSSLHEWFPEISVPMQHVANRASRL